MMGEFTDLTVRLSNLSSQTTAQAVIILRRKQLIAHTGKLPSAAIQELVELINSFSRISAQNLQRQVSPSRQKAGNGDMVRFIQLQSTQSKYLLYAISLYRDVLLALVFDNTTQFSVVRRQTMQIARDLLTPHPILPPEHLASDIELGGQAIAQPPEPAQPTVDFDTSESLPASQIPEPAPEQVLPIESESSLTHAYQPEPGKNEFDAETPPNGEIPNIGIEEQGVKVSTPGDAGVINYHDSAELEDQGVNGTPAFIPLAQDQAGQVDPEIESHPAPAPVSLGNYITYSCLLIPRMPQHLLTSNLASYLFKWMGQLCLAYGWRLEHLSIHSSHIQWIAGAPLIVSPAFLVRTLRHKTSQYIFTQFPILANENPSGDFWAPGFFISGGKQTIQAHLIDRHVKEIRTQQGVYNSAFYQ